MKRTLFTLTAILVVMATSADAAITMVQDYESGGAPFTLDPNFSGSTSLSIDASSTFGLVADGVAGSTMAGELVLVDNTTSGGWITRFLADGAGNLDVPLIPTNGYIGYLLKVDAQYAGVGIVTGPALDDPGTADVGIPKAVIADGEWHLYQWNLGDNSDWTTFDAYYGSSGLGDGILTGPTLKYDSIAIQSANGGDAVVRIDNISFDPDGRLVIPEPTSLVLAGFGLIGLVLAARRRR